MKRSGARLRVIGGTLRGRRLIAPSGRSIRPTSDRVREALFDILGRRVSGAFFLDACAGTGAVGIEALSRGARFVAWIEKDGRALELLERNIQVAGGVAGGKRILALDIPEAVAALEREGFQFDLIYLDPPYGGGQSDRALRLVGASRLLKPDTLVIVEHEASEAPAAVSSHGRLRPERTVTYGRAALTFFSTGRTAAAGDDSVD
ncbi:MAG TPA: 16S rRNA (guanine(966)-N(2))-methyltransferase RsmD [Candidatus Polarisedimenticolia bacterium]|nr:16S rRNA (guanine(966)-N(2))-methyltransferase RsmD [Candidatus Polarisedimenticolia bacterium]